VVQERRVCQGCGKAWTAFDPEVVPYFRHARSVITRALTERGDGQSWEKCAEACTEDGQVDPSTVKRWSRRFQLVEGGLLRRVAQPRVLFRPAARTAILSAPAGSRSPDPQQEDPWERAPPTEP
jgi:hypothetical protein